MPHESPKHLRDLMLAAALAITGGGYTMYELAVTGTPIVAIRLAENQTPSVQAMGAAGVLAYDSAGPPGAPSSSAVAGINM